MRRSENPEISTPGRGSRSDIQEELVEEIEEAVDDLEVDPENSDFLVFSDFNGPIVNADSADWEPKPGLKEAASDLESSLDYKPLLLSGWDPRTLENAADTFLDSDFDIVGDRGTTAILDGELLNLSNESPSVLNRFRAEVYQLMTDYDAVLHEQGNFSPVVGAVKANAANKGIQKHPLYQESVKNYTAEDFYQKITQNVDEGDHYRLEGENIVIEDLNPETVETFSRVWREEYPLIGFEIEENEDSLHFRENSDYNSSEFSFDSFSNDLSQIAQSYANIGLDHHSDNTSDIYRTDVNANKIYGANRIQDIRTNDSSIIFNIGDKPVDVLNKPNSVNFVQRDSEAEDYCIKNGIPHVSALNFVDYAKSVSDYVRKNE